MHCWFSSCSYNRVCSCNYCVIWVRSSGCVIFNYLITQISVNTTNKLTTIIFIVYSYMFRLTWVIFRLELNLFAMSLCSFWDPRRLHVFCIDVIYCIIIVGCNNIIVMVLMLIVAHYSRWISSQAVSVLLVGPLFLFPWLSGGCVFLGYVFRGFSPCVLACNLRTWVSSIVLIAWSTDIYVYIVKINGMYYLQIFRGWGLLILCVVVDGLCLDVAFTSGWGECLHTTGLLDTHHTKHNGPTAVVYMHTASVFELWVTHQVSYLLTIYHYINKLIALFHLLSSEERGTTFIQTLMVFVFTDLAFIHKMM